MHGHSFTWFSHIPFLNQLPEHIVTAAFVALLLIVTTFVARVQLMSAMAKADGALVPEPRLSYRNFFEIIAEQLYKLTENVLGHHEAPKYFPLIGTVFVFILANNLLGLLPGFAGATADMNLTFAMGIFVFIYYNYVGLRTNGLAYLKHFMGPIWWLAPAMLLIELISHIFRPLSLGLRLRGNMMGDHTVLGIFLDMVPYGVPVLFLGLGLFVSFVQAFVFSLLTMIYVHLATAHEEH